jgi:Skp family chaperone for outer membrane proteins
MDAIYEADSLEGFAALSDRALSNKDVDGFIELLEKREMMKDIFRRQSRNMNRQELFKQLEKERAIARRLRKESEKVLFEMDSVAKTTKVQKKYCSRFSPARIPVFIDIKA